MLLPSYGTPARGCKQERKESKEKERRIQENGYDVILLESGKEKERRKNTHFSFVDSYFWKKFK